MDKLLISLLLLVFFVAIAFMLYRMRVLYKKNLELQERYQPKTTHNFKDIQALVNTFVERELPGVMPRTALLTEAHKELYEEGMSYYLIGFVNDLSKYFSLNEQLQNALLMNLLRSQLSLSPIHLIRYCTEASNEDPAALVRDMMKIGGIAFYSWIDKADIPLSISMKAQVNSFVLSMRHSMKDEERRYS